MLKTIDIEDLNINDYPIESQASLAFYKHRNKINKNLDFKIQETKKGKYLNIYEYDKKRWRYILIDKIKL